jgi:predicted AlkP superfamily phosphohydrolase/phosphomutase
MLKTPGQTNGARRLSGLRIYDVAPTILDLYGLPVPPRMQGRVIR